MRFARKDEGQVDGERHADPTPEQVQDWDEWVSERPKAVRENSPAVRSQTVEALPAPWVRTPGHALYFRSMPEAGGRFAAHAQGGRQRTFPNLLAFGPRRVFGIKPEDLEECDLPSEDAPLGSILSGDEVSAAVDGVSPGEPRARAIRDAATRSLQGRTPQGDA